MDSSSRRDRNSINQPYGFSEGKFEPIERVAQKCRKWSSKMIKFTCVIAIFLGMTIADAIKNKTVAASGDGKIITCRGKWPTDPNNYYFEWNGKDVIAYVVIQNDIQQKSLPVGMTTVDETCKIKFDTKHYTITIEHAPEAEKGVGLIFSGIDLTSLGVDTKFPPATANFMCE
jgi:hypothetical protein